MFNETKSLIVVYKDEMLVNQVRKLVETKDDTEDAIVGTRDGSVKIVSWNEKMWLSQKKSGAINNKVLFIGDIKGTDQLMPVIDIKYEKYGVCYGWAGNQAILACDTKKIDEEEYQKFLKEIENLDIPDFIKNANKINEVNGGAEEDKKEKKEVGPKKNNQDDKTPMFLKNVKRVMESGVDKMGEAFEIASQNAEDIKRAMFKDKAAMKRQMLFFGIITLYNNDLEKFMNS